MSSKRILSAILIGLLLVSVAGCGTNTATTAATAATTAGVTSATTIQGTTVSAVQATSAAPAAKKRTYAVVFPIVHPFFEPVAKDAEKYGKENGWDIITKAPDTANAQLQIEIMENLIAMKVDGIAVGPTDPVALVPTIDKALAAGIKVICFETDAPNSKKLAYIGTDNYNAGRHMGEVIGRNLNGKGNIMILTGLPTQMSLNERIRGIKEYLAEKYKDIKITDTQSSEGDAQKAVTATENMIQSHPDFNAIIGIDATAGPAAISVWKAKGWQNSKDKWIITFDDMPDNLQGLKDGYIKGIVSQRQNSWGKGVLVLLNDLVNGKDVPKSTDTGSIEITMNNINTYLNEPSYKEAK